MTRAAAVLALAAAGAALAACRSAEPPPAPPLHPYKVVLLPVEGARAALAEAPGPDDVPLALAPEQLEAKIRDTIAASRVFAAVVVADPAELAARRGEDEMSAAAAIARRTSSDLLLRVQVRRARMTDLGNNGATFWSTLTWFMVPAPIWVVDDRTYDTDIAVQAELYDPADPARPAASVVATSGRQDLDLWDRGLSWYVIVVPPAFLEGSAETVSEALTERAVEQLLVALVEELRTREIPSRFDVDVAEAAGGVRIVVGSRRRLRSLAVEAGGRPVRTWAETELAEDADSTPERFVYRRTVPVEGARGAAVRVVAEDEAGGREVRTLVLEAVR